MSKVTPYLLFDQSNYIVLTQVSQAMNENRWFIQWFEWDFT